MFLLWWVNPTASSLSLSISLSLAFSSFLFLSALHCLQFTAMAVLEFAQPFTLFSPMRGTTLLHLLFIVMLQQGFSTEKQFQIIQTPSVVFAMSGNTVTLNCIINMEKVGAVVWKKHSGNNNLLFYSDILQQNGATDIRISWVHSVRIFDQSIQIKNITLQDTGVYHCVKLDSYKKEYRVGSGVTLIIIATPSYPQITVDHFSSTEDDNSIKLTCTSHGFSPHHIMVTWLKDKDRVLSSQSHVDSQNSNFSFNVNSTVTIQLQKEDIKSAVYCVVNHTALQIPLTKAFYLGRIMQVQPTLSLDSVHKVLVNTSVRLNCTALEFYP
ncbi:tyrosine-protein phosphatase non-receptor type substrate 1-like isoform X1 [Protopterus annectens]|uniref:tyrosine-protein phosphatase non-receptor type substrate 1-like isoform X1 n=1 Tax=Protopterus annectens TaxID=7888 RepID=UPI001CF9D4D5|nr:tyrosine-protein phosphatase non-receptor type substrate 1-like isoform X1 [Protopterus annectens]